MVDTFRPDNAPGVTKLFTEVYGNGYPMKMVYDPAALTEAFQRGVHIPVVARTPEGRVIGHEAFCRAAESAGMYEFGQGPVLPAYRNRGVISRIDQYALEEMTPSMELDAVFRETACDQTFMQRSRAAFRTIPTALEVDLMPADA